MNIKKENKINTTKKRLIKRLRENKSINPYNLIIIMWAESGHIRTLNQE